VLDEVQRNHRVLIAGPSTLAALLNSFQMGFRTLAIQKRASDAWKLLGAVKEEFKTFDELLQKASSKLDDASRIISEDVGRRTRAIKRKLSDIQELPASDAAAVLGLTPTETVDTSNMLSGHERAD
jgi:DNA recombination protein RmuC